MKREIKKIIITILIIALAWVLFNLFFYHSYNYDEFREETLTELREEKEKLSPEDAGKLELYIEQLVATQTENEFFDILETIPDFK